MRVSTKGRYAIRFMLDLALHNTGEPVRIKDVATRQNISDKYLEQVVSILNKARRLCSYTKSRGLHDGTDSSFDGRRYGSCRMSCR